MCQVLSRKFPQRSEVSSMFRCVVSRAARSQWHKAASEARHFPVTTTRDHGNRVVRQAPLTVQVVTACTFWPAQRRRLPRRLLKFTIRLEGPRRPPYETKRRLLLREDPAGPQAQASLGPFKPAVVLCCRTIDRRNQSSAGAALGRTGTGKGYRVSANFFDGVLIRELRRSMGG